VEPDRGHLHGRRACGGELGGHSALVEDVGSVRRVDPRDDEELELPGRDQTRHAQAARKGGVPALCKSRVVLASEEDARDREMALHLVEALWLDVCLRHVAFEERGRAHLCEAPERHVLTDAVREDRLDRLVDVVLGPSRGRLDRRGTVAASILREERAIANGQVDLMGARAVSRLGRARDREGEEHDGRKHQSE
jgi:hypothetical protein